MPKKLEPETPEWWRAAARRLADSPGSRARCRIMAKANSFAGKALLSNDECHALARDDAFEAAACGDAYRVMENEQYR